MKWLLNLYPPAWQRRFRKEVEFHLEESGTSGFRAALDLLAGAVDAWQNPGSIPNTKGESSMKVCIHEPGSVAISRSDGMKQGLLTIGLTLGLVIPCMVIDKVYGEIVPVKALMLSSWMIAFIVASRGTYLKVYSRAARNVITVVMSAVVYLIILTALWVAAVT